jgi:hypothetical protein
MNGCRLKGPRKKVIPEPFDLHVFMTYQAEINQHIQTDKQLDDPPRMLVVQLKRSNPIAIA